MHELLLTDWKIGGHDNGVPRFEPDPALGSRDEFVEAIQRCHEVGVYVTTRVNLQPVSRHSEWFRNELHSFASIDRWGIVATQLGWGHGGTLTDTFSSGERRAWLGVSSDAMRQILVSQMCELAHCGVDGIHVSDFFARPLDFNRTSGKTADRATWEGAFECLQAIRDACQAIRPGFAISMDSAWDQVRRVGRSLSIESPVDSPLRHAIPSFRMDCLVSEADDFQTVNEAVRTGSRIRLAPAVSDDAAARPLTEYISTIQRAQRILRHSLLEGGVIRHVRNSWPDQIAFNVFENPQSGLRSTVLVNVTSEPKQVFLDDELRIV